MANNIEWIDNETIYQILIDRFNGEWKSNKNTNDFMGGNINGILEKLDYIQDLGITTIWLSPISCSVNYHGYHITDFMNVDPHFGTMNDFCKLVNEVHKRNMKIIIDFVPNHCSIEHPFFKEAYSNINSKYRKWFYFKKNKYISFLQYKELAKINLDNNEAADYIINVARYYCKIGVDGLRIDHAVGPSFKFWEKAMRSLKQEFPNKIFFGEIWSHGIKRKYYYTLHFKSLYKKIKYYLFSIKQESWQRDYIGVLDGVLDFEYRNILLNEIKKGKRIINNKDLELNVIKHFKKYPQDFKLILFLDNHDTDRFLFSCNKDISLLKEAIIFSQKCHKAFIIYYGTEQGMCNEETIFNGKPYADLNVRECMDWNIDKKNTLYYSIKQWLKDSKR